MHGSPSLKLRHLPPFAAINSFSHWPDGLKLETTDNEWHVLLYGGDDDVGDRVGRAAARMATCASWERPSGSILGEEKRMCLRAWSFDGGEARSGGAWRAAASGAATLSADCNHIHFLELQDWPVSAQAVRTIGAYLNQVRHLTLTDCSLDEGDLEPLSSWPAPLALLEVRDRA